MAKGTLKLNDNTPLKPWPFDSKTLVDMGFAPDWRKGGETFRILDSYLWEGVKASEADDHIVVLFEDGTVRYIYAGHCQISLDEDPENNPKEEETKTGKTLLKVFNRGALFKVPGISHKVGSNDPIYKGSKFTWGEATKNGTRIPESTAITYNIVKAAHLMDDIRKYLGGGPIRCTSWYRDSVTNRKVGGASRSYHLTGKAVDFYPTKIDLIDAFYKMKEFPAQGGLAVGRGFIHYDFGPRRRWRYPNGPMASLW